MRYDSRPEQPAGRLWLRIAVLLAIQLLLLTARSAAQEVLVGPGQPVTSIAAAIERASPGDRIRILAGVYREGPILVDRPLTLVGEGWPELDGEGKHPVLVIDADSVTVRGLVVRNAGVSHVQDNAGIRVEAVRDCTIEGNRLVDNFFGIYLAKTRGCRIADNVITASGTRESASGNGIHLWNASGVSIDENLVSGHRDGIYLEFASDTRLTGNRSENNLRYGLHFMFSSETVYARNAFRGNAAGVAVMYSKRVEMVGNEFADSWGAAAYGLLLKEITDSRLEGNTFSRNTVGLYSEGTSRLEVRGNRFLRNGWAVRIRSNSRNNTFTANDFVDNAFEVSTDTRQNANTFTGNYWSKYSGYDLTGDGFGDVPHRPVRLFSLIVERTPAALVLLRTFFVDVLDLAERVMPVLTPETLVDDRPRIREASL